MSGNAEPRQSTNSCSSMASSSLRDELRWNCDGIAMELCGWECHRRGPNLPQPQPQPQPAPPPPMLSNQRLSHTARDREVTLRHFPPTPRTVAALYSEGRIHLKSKHIQYSAVTANYCRRGAVQSFFAFFNCSVCLLTRFLGLIGRCGQQHWCGRAVGRAAVLRLLVVENARSRCTAILCVKVQLPYTPQVHSGDPLALQYANRS